MKRSRAYLNLSKANANKVADKAKSILLQMTGNPDFPTPVESLEELAELVDELHISIAEQLATFHNYQEKTKKIGAIRDKLIFRLESQGAYVTTTADGDSTKILSAGFDIRNAPISVSKPDAPINVLAEEGNAEGILICTWKKVRLAKSYNVEQSLDINNPNGWIHIQTVTKARCVVEHLISGSRIWFRVSAINSVGEGGFSDVCTRIVP